MKKVTSVILCLCLTLGLILPYGVFAESEEVPEAYLYDTVEIMPNGSLEPGGEVLSEGSFGDVVEYMNYSKAGGTIVLSEDTRLEKDITLQSVNGTVPYVIVGGGDVSFDLNGYTITQQSGTEESLKPVFVVPKNSRLQIVDSSDERTGTVNGVCGAAAVKGGNLRLASGTLKAQAQASVSPDDGELVVQVSDSGFFSMSDGGKIEFDGELEDGRTYFGKSCAIYIDGTSKAVISGGTILGNIETAVSENLVIEGGSFDKDITDYVVPVMEIVQKDNMYNVYYPWPEETTAVFNGLTLPVAIDLKLTEDESSLENIDVFVSPLAGGEIATQFGKITFGLTEIFKSIKTMCNGEYPSICFSTYASECFAQEVVLDSDNVKKIADAAGDEPIFLEIEMTDIVDEEIKQQLETARVTLEYSFVDEEGRDIEADVKFEAEIPFPYQNDADFQVYTENASGYVKKAYEYRDKTMFLTVNEDKKLVIAQGSSMSITGRTLDLEGTISMIFYANLQGVEAGNVRMLFWDSPQTDYTAETALRSVKYTSKDANGYRFVYEDIASKEMNKQIYARLVAEDADGKLIYGAEPQSGYSIVKYAQNMMSNSQMKPLLVKMLNYGSAAQEYFGSDDVPANSILADVEKVTDYTKIYKSDAKVIEEPSLNGECPAEIAGKTLTLEGDISINYYITCDEDVDEIGVMFWSEDSFGDTENHIMGTQTKRINDFTVNGSYKVFSYDNIVSSKMSEPLYARVYTKKDNVYRYGNVDKYCVKDYAAKQIEKNEDKALIKLLRCLLLYGEEAEKYFNAKSL